MTQVSQQQLSAIWAALNDTPQKSNLHGAASPTGHSLGTVDEATKRTTLIQIQRGQLRV